MAGALLHVSVEQASPSPHMAGLESWTHPAGPQESSVHGLKSSQFSGVPPTQPLPGLHVSPPLHGMVSSQTSGEPAWQTPAEQVSVPLQVLPSPHELVLSCVKTQPEADWQESSVQRLPSLQTTGVVAQPVAG